MHIVVVGVDHTTAPIALREQLACSPRQTPQLLVAARQIAREAVLLSTCNRVELYVVSADEAKPAELSVQLKRLWNEHRQVELEELEAHCYEFVDAGAVEHLFGVASGLHSLIPGEPQIQGQVAEALEIAQAGSFAGPISSALFRAALTTGKRARHETGISRNATSISHAAVQLARQHFPSLNESHVLLVGSGQMSELAARNLHDHGAQRLVIINRTSAHAQALAQQFGDFAVHRTFAELAAALVEAEVVIVSTRAPRALITVELMCGVLQQRAGRPILFIDLSVPRDIEPAVADLPGVHLYNIDDLQATAAAGIQLRLHEEPQVRTIIAEESQTFERWLRSLSVVDTISDLRTHVDDVRERELTRTLRQLSPALSEREVAAVREFSTRLVNKLLHQPTRRLKDAAASGQGPAYAEALRYLFALEVEEENDQPHYDWNAGQQAGPDPDAASQSATARVSCRPGD